MRLGGPRYGAASIGIEGGNVELLNVNESHAQLRAELAARPR